MKRLCISAVLLVAAMSTGCCYYPGYINPYDGMAYGGQWVPCYGGPIDPLGWRYAFNCGGYGGQGGCGQAACCQQECCQPPCGPDCCYDGQVPGGFVPPSMQPTYTGDGINAPCINPQPPAGSLQPVPDPNLKEKKGVRGGSATYVYPPHQQPAIQEASQRPWVEAY